MAKKDTQQGAARRQRREQPVEIWKIDTEAEDNPRSKVEHDGSVHDTVSAVRFIRTTEMDGKFEIVRILGTIDSRPVTSRKVVVG